MTSTANFGANTNYSDGITTTIWFFQRVVRIFAGISRRCHMGGIFIEKIYMKHTISSIQRKIGQNVIVI